MTRPHITRQDGQIRLTYTAPMLTVILTDEQARELMAEGANALQADLPTSQIDLPTSHPEIPHLPGWTRVVDAVPLDQDQKIQVLWASTSKTHWRYTEAP